MSWYKNYINNMAQNNKDYYEELHIGKSSFGWYFGLQIYPQHNINTLEDWKKLFNEKDVKIFSEEENRGKDNV